MSVASNVGTELSCRAFLSSFEAARTVSRLPFSRFQNACWTCSSGRMTNSQYAPRMPVSMMTNEMVTIAIRTSRGGAR